MTSSIGAIFVWLLVPETSGKTLEEIEIFFTHLRREAMDMIGDREACREPKKVPFFIFIEDKNKTAKLVRIPKFSEVPYPVIMEPSLVIEYYSR